MSRNQKLQQQQEQAGTAPKAGGKSKASAGPLFKTGRMVITRGAMELLGSVPMGFIPLLRRHVRGDFGDVCDLDWELNQRAIEGGSRVLSSYRVGGDRVWLITEADRSATTLLLPSEY